MLQSTKLGRAYFKTFCKEMDLNFYLPLTSTHHPDTIYSLTFGSICAYFLHDTRRKDFEQVCVHLTMNSLSCGWKWEQQNSHINNTEAALMAKQKQIFFKNIWRLVDKKILKKTSSNWWFLKLPYHPQWVQWHQIIFLAPKGLSIYCGTTPSTWYTRQSMHHKSWEYSLSQSIEFTYYKSSQL